MNIYPLEEIERINKLKETNDKLEDFFSDKRIEWNKNIEPLFESLRVSFSIENSSKIVDLQATALSFRQLLNEQISLFLNKRSKEEVKLKRVKQDKFLFYAIGIGLKTNNSEKSTLIDAHTSESERCIQLIDSHVEFLRSCSKNLESVGYTLKNIIELFNYLK